MSLKSKIKNGLKSSYKESADTALDSISAMQTLLSRYPIADVTELNGDSTNNSMSFMFSILRLIGVSQNDIITFFAELLSGKGSDGFLTGLEYAVKSLLLANIKNLLTCSLNPILPDKFMFPEDMPTGRHIYGEGIPIKISDIDLFGLLEKSPVSKDNGSIYYFDALDPIYNIDTNTDIIPSYSPNHLWQSCDFNAYLWYIIHRSPSAERNYYWDNRVRHINEMSNDHQLRDQFFNTLNDTEHLHTRKQYVGGSGSKRISRYEIIRCRFEETPTTGDDNILRVYINPWRYANRSVTMPVWIKSKKNLSLSINSTLFEFNFEYIWSLKLFESKTLVANILGEIFNTRDSMTFSFSYEKEVVKQHIKNIVEQVIQADDTEIDDCYYKFDNDTYDTLLEQAKQKYDGVYKITDDQDYGTIDASALADSINDIDNATTLVEQQTKIANIFTTYLPTSGETDESTNNLKFSFGSTIIDKLLKETVTQIVLQILTPKVAVLFKINSAIMGDISYESIKDDVENKNIVGFDTWEDFLKNFSNLVFQLVIEIKNMILKSLYTFMMQYLSQIIQLFALELLKEAVRDYKKLIKDILSHCTLSSIGSISGRFSNIAIDNVNYADIVPTETQPNNDSCE